MLFTCSHIVAPACWRKLSVWDVLWTTRLTQNNVTFIGNCSYYSQWHRRKAPQTHLQSGSTQCFQGTNDRVQSRTKTHVGLPPSHVLCHKAAIGGRPLNPRLCVAGPVRFQRVCQRLFSGPSQSHAASKLPRASLLFLFRVFFFQNPECFIENMHTLFLHNDTKTVQSLFVNNTLNAKPHIVAPTPPTPLTLGA